MAKKVWGKTGKCVANKIPSIWYIKYNDEFMPKYLKPLYKWININIAWA